MEQMQKSARRLRIVMALICAFLVLCVGGNIYAAETDATGNTTTSTSAQAKEFKDTTGAYTYRLVAAPDVTTKAGGTVAVEAAQEIHKADDSAYGTFVIPEKVKVDDVTYDVVAIDANAFGSVTKIANVVIPDSVATIDKDAFVAKGVTAASLDASNLAADNKDTVKNTATDKAVIFCNAGSKAETFAAENSYTAKTDGIQLTASSSTVATGSTATVKAALPGFLSSDTAITWTSSDQNVATVAADGTVTGVKEGTATITATADGLKAQTALNVQAAATTTTVQPSASVTATPSPSTTVSSDTTAASSDSAITTQSIDSTSASTVETQSTASIKYRTHIQNIAWQDPVSDGAIAGTTNQGLRAEAINISVSGVENLGVTYRTHLANLGWQSWSSDWEQSGTTGRAIQMEALEVKLTGSAASNYTVYYRAYVENYGWMGWVKDGETAGTTGMSHRIEAVQIVIRSAGSEAPGSTENGYLNGASVRASTSVNYQAHVQNVGWQGWVSNGETAGTTGRGLRLEAVQASLSGSLNSSSIQYNSYVNGGWQGWVSNGEVSGTTGQQKKIEMVQFQLTGTASKLFDVYYRSYVQDIGWLGWAKNGEQSGTTGGDLRIEALEIKLVAKGAAAPGSTDNAYMDKHVDYRQAIVNTAAGEVGYTESNDWTKYGQWYQDTFNASGFAYGEWCAMFVSWCANQSGVSSDIIPYHAYCPTGVNWFRNQGEYQGNGYVPSAGDLIYYDWNFDGTVDHVGLVTGYDSNTGYITTVEGNTGWNTPCVSANSYPYNWSYINGYGVPKY